MERTVNENYIGGSYLISLYNILTFLSFCMIVFYKVFHPSGDLILVQGNRCWVSHVMCWTGQAYVVWDGADMVYVEVLDIQLLGRWVHFKWIVNYKPKF